MRCPRCRRLFDILQWRPLDIPAAFQLHLTPVYKCPKNQQSVDPPGETGCGFLFAPADLPPGAMI